MDQKKNILSRPFCRSCDYFRLRGITDSVLCRNSRNEARSRQSGSPLHSRKIYLERSCACFHCPHHRNRIYVWKPVQHSLQPRGRCTQPRSYDFHEEKIRIQHPRHQCCRRCFPQHRSAHHRRSYHDDFRTDLLCTGTFNLRCHYRTSHRNADKRGTETYPLLNNTKNAEY